MICTRSEVLCNRSKLRSSLGGLSPAALNSN